MDFLELAKKRCSVRKYKELPVEREKIIKVLEAARLAPSACNYQPVYFIVVQDQATRENIYGSYPGRWLKQAPVIIVACGDHSQSWKRGDGKDHCDIDVAIAIDHMTLAAAEEGLGICWICAFDAELCHEILELPEDMEVIALLPIGYPQEESDEERHNRQRKPLDQIVGWDRWESSSS